VIKGEVMQDQDVEMIEDDDENQKINEEVIIAM
jgi:hypothetical protein